MKVAKVQVNSVYKKNNTGKKVGTLAGAAIGSAYIGKNAKDIFIERGKEAAKELGNKNIGIAIAAGISALTVGAFILAGRTIGAIIDSIHDKKDRKAEENNEKTYTVNELN